MRRTHCISVLLIASAMAFSAQGADLTKIDRTIAKEPAYKTKPKYCLLVFGPEAKTRVWLVMDGDVLYVDRNGNGDLTATGDRATLNGPYQRWESGDIHGPDGKLRYRVFGPALRLPGLQTGEEMNGDPIIAHVLFTDGAKRPVYLEASGKQYVLGYDGEKVHGVWYLPPEERIGPDAVVDADPDPF